MIHVPFRKTGVYRTRGGGFARVMERADSLVVKGELDGVVEFWSARTGKHLPCAGIAARPGRDLLARLRPLSEDKQ